MTLKGLPHEPLRPFNVLAFDPGGTTGWAFASLPQYVLDGLDSLNDLKIQDIYLQTGEFGPDPHYQELHEFLWQLGNQEHPRAEVVFEPFNFRQHLDNPRHKVNLISCEYIGVIKLACQQLGLSYYDRFVPGEAKAYCPNDKLDKLGWLQTPVTPMRHRNDALRQLVKYLIVKKRIRHPLTTAWRD